jgi:hypothetical protein
VLLSIATRKTTYQLIARPYLVTIKKMVCSADHILENPETTLLLIVARVMNGGHEI